MRRTLLLPVLGAVAGAALAYNCVAVAQIATSVRQSSNRACAEPSDPDALLRAQRAAAAAEQLPIGPRRQQALQQAARSYASQNAEAALTWARNLQPREPGLVPVVFDAVAECEPIRAFDLAMTLESVAERTQALLGVSMRGGSSDDEQARALADKILGIQDASSADMLLQALVLSWGLNHPRTATDWLLAHVQQVSPLAFTAVANRFGEVDPATAATYLNRVPAEARAAWITGVARGYSRADLQTALDFIARFRDEPSYDSVAGSFAQTLAQYDPPAAAKLLDGVDLTAGMNAGAAMIVGQQWALRDPAPAANWALRLSDRTARLGTLMSAAQLWARADLLAARTWVLSLAAGENRDAALRGLLPELVAVELPDAALLDAFSSETAAQRVLATAVVQASFQNPDNARRVIETYVTDPDLRARAERSIETAARMRASIVPGAQLPLPVGPSPVGPLPVGPSPAGPSPAGPSPVGPSPVNRFPAGSDRTPGGTGAGPTTPGP
jgi:hypothetical protein